MRYFTASLGLSAVALFGTALLVFASLNPDFHYVEDYVSKLGAQGQPHALWWNLIGFLLVGAILTMFGWAYGQVLQDRLTGVLLAMFGVGFTITALPTDMGDAASALSKAHTVAICLALAAWLFGLARMAHMASLGRFVYCAANTAAILAVVPIVGYGLRLWSMPVTHRLVFAVVFGWIVLTSFRLLWGDADVPDSADQCDALEDRSRAFGQ